MYLSDRDIKGELANIDFETEDTDFPFRPDEQVQPCSVDLRLDRVFWKQVSTYAVDLRSAKLLEVSPRRHWSRIVLNRGESITLKPGHMLLGRTYEKFSVPTNLAGKLEGRSSFGRLGLGIHCSADFINPGWRGRMPLELVNFSRSPIKLFPLIPVCQVMFVKLSSAPDVLYGAKELSSKYMDDDGGPSYWWRDKRVTALQSALGDQDVAELVQAEILETIGPRDPDLIHRFEVFVRNRKRDELTNANEILERFAKTEDWRRVRARVTKGVQVGAAPALLTSSIGSLFRTPYWWLHFVLWGATALAVPVSLWGLRRGLGEYYGTDRFYKGG